MSQAGPNYKQQQVPERADLRQKIQARIRRLEKVSGNGLWSMLLFLMVSFAAFDDFSILPDLSEATLEILGASPPVELIALALVIYAFSGIIRTLASMSRNIKPYMGLMHAAFFTGFYTFYHLAGALQDNFWAIFFAGISVMGLENYYLWTYSSEAINKEQALLDSMRRDNDEN
jgi:hypothetical protein